MENLERWVRHSAMSDTTRYGAAVAALPSGIGALNGVVQGVIIHSDWLGAYGVAESDFARVSRETLPVAERSHMFWTAMRVRSLSAARPRSVAWGPAAISR
jgi:hypothetical protein